MAEPKARAKGKIAAAVKRQFTSLPTQLNAEAIEGLKCVIQFDLTTDGGNSYHVVIDEGESIVRQGKHPTPDAIITMTAKDYEMVPAVLDVQLATIRGRIKIEQKGSFSAKEMAELECSLNVDTHGPGKGRPGGGTAV